MMCWATASVPCQEYIKDKILTIVPGISFIKFTFFLFSFAAFWSSLWKFCIVWNLSDESHSISAAMFCCSICDKTWSQLKITDNILLSKFWGIKVSFSFSKFLSIEIFLLNKLNKEAVYSGMLETSILFTLGKLPGNVTYWA